MFLVHHDHSQAGQGGQHTQAGGNNDIGSTCGRFKPGLGSSQFSQVAVHHHHAVGCQAFFVQGLCSRGQVDFRQQHQYLLPAFQAFFDRVQIHFCFATAGYAV